jgi:DNA-binding HxlR family transcriptional regulator
MSTGVLPHVLSDEMAHRLREIVDRVAGKWSMQVIHELGPAPCASPN